MKGGGYNKALPSDSEGSSDIYIVQRIVTTEDRHDRRETLCLV